MISIGEAAASLTPVEPETQKKEKLVSFTVCPVDNGFIVTSFFRESSVQLVVMSKAQLKKQIKRILENV